MSKNDFCSNEKSAKVPDTTNVTRALLCQPSAAPDQNAELKARFTRLPRSLAKISLNVALGRLVAEEKTLCRSDVEREH